MKRILFLKIIMCAFLFSCLIILSEGLSNAEDIFYAQAQAGDSTGSSCSNAKAISTLTWGLGAGNIGAGDTAHLCGTITSTITVGSSGSAGSPITIKYETGAKSSKAAWGTANNSAIYANGKSYVVIDGGINGIIENTDNGTNKGNKIESTAINFVTSSNLEVKNLTCQHMYDAVEGPNNIGYGHFLQFTEGGHDVIIHNNTVSDGGYLIAISYTQTGADRNFIIYNNTISNAGIGMVFGSARDGSTIDNVQIYNNTMSRGFLWSGTSAIHTNLIQAFAVHTNSSITNLKIYNNTFSGVCGTNATSLVFVEGAVISPQLYNNNLHYETNVGTGCGNGMMYMKETQGGVIDNNTFSTTDYMVETALSFSNGTNVTVKNNKFYNVFMPISLPYSITAVSVCDYNIFPAGSIRFNYGSYSQDTYDVWRARSGFDTHSTIGAPNASYPKPPSNIGIR